MRIKKQAAIILLAAFIMMLAAGCGGQASSDKGSDKAAESSKKITVLRVGSETTFPPFEMPDGKGGYTGFDMDLIRAIGEAEGVKVQIQSQGFDGLIPALQAGNIDVAISGMTITEERKKSVDFSEPYYTDPNGGLMIAVRSDETGLDTPEKLAGKTIAAQIGTTGAAYAQALAKKYPGTKVKIFNTVDVAFADLKNKGCDAVINDRPVTQAYIDKGHPEVKLVGQLLTKEQYGIAVKKGNTEVLNLINDGLKKVKESGKYDELYKKYFNK